MIAQKRHRARRTERPKPLDFRAGLARHPLGHITPPFGLNQFAACTVANLPVQRIIVPTISFIAAVVACLVLITPVPPISLGLRDLVYR